MIDTHAHLGKVIYGYDPLTPKELIKFMDKYGIEKSVILPLVNPEEEHYYYTTEMALEDCKRYPDRFIPFVNIDPRRGKNNGTLDFYPIIKEYADRGCKGFGEILANLPTNDKRLKSIYKVCGQLGLPVLPDLRPTYCTAGVIEPLGMPYLEEVLEEFPQTIFIGHGPAFWAEISADIPEKVYYPKGKVEKPGRVNLLLEKYPNLHADLSAGSGYGAMSRDLDYAKIFLALTAS
ncbi:MAG: amidohydrolase [bacterium]|nr:amidohydrolase [bacterium]